MRRPLVIAHRGSSAQALENTLPAFERAIQEGADGVEFDVWQCGSGEVVVTHDRDLTRATGQPGNVEKQALSQLKKLNFGHQEEIPTLEEALDITQSMELINIEIKGKHYWGNGIEKKILQCLRDRKILDRTIVSSFNPGHLWRLRCLDKKIKIGLIFYENSFFPLKRAWAANLLKPYSLHPSFKLLTPRLRARAQKKRQKVFAWTINNIHDLERCIQNQVDGMITDDPAWMIQQLEKEGNLES